MIDIDFIKNNIWIPKKDILLSPKMHKLFLRLSQDYGNAQDKKIYDEHRNASNALENCIFGKYAELVAALFFRNNGFPHIMPNLDPNIPINKKWNPDLPFGNKNFPNFHVKSCNFWLYQKLKGEFSWTFQYKDKDGPNGTDKLFNDLSSKELTVFVYVKNLVEGISKIMATAPWCLFNKLLVDPEKPDLKGIKKCLNFKDLEKAAANQNLL